MQIAITFLAALRVLLHKIVTYSLGCILFRRILGIRGEYRRLHDSITLPTLREKTMVRLQLHKETV